MLARIEGGGGALAPAKSGNSRRYSLCLLGFVFLVLAVVADLMPRTGAREWSTVALGEAPVLGLVAMALLLVLAALMMSTRGSFNLRSTSILAGVGSGMSVLVAFWMPVPWLETCRLAAPLVPLAAAGGKGAAQAIDALRNLGWMANGGTLLVGLLACGMASFSA